MQYSLEIFRTVCYEKRFRQKTISLHLMIGKQHFASFGICLMGKRSYWQKKNALPFRYAKMGRWMGKTTVRDESMPKGVRIAESEIDLLCISADAKQYLLGECKLKTSPFSYSEYLDTLAKLSSLKKEAKFYYALFSESGFDEKIIEEAAGNNTMLYTLEQIVNYK